ncbi:hypothetical protein JCM8547_007155 [Rhodosporidiobolus lusitaniae]
MLDSPSRPLRGLLELPFELLERIASHVWVDDSGFEGEAALQALSYPCMTLRESCLPRLYSHLLVEDHDEDGLRLARVEAHLDQVTSFTYSSLNNGYSRRIRSMAIQTLPSLPRLRTIAFDGDYHCQAFGHQGAYAHSELESCRDEQKLAQVVNSILPRATSLKLSCFTNDSMADTLSHARNVETLEIFDLWQYGHRHRPPNGAEAAATALSPAALEFIITLPFLHTLILTQTVYDGSPAVVVQGLLSAGNLPLLRTLLMAMDSRSCLQVLKLVHRLADHLEALDLQGAFYGQQPDPAPPLFSSSFPRLRLLSISNATIAKTPLDFPSLLDDIPSLSHFSLRYDDTHPVVNNKYIFSPSSASALVSYCTTRRIDLDTNCLPTAWHELFPLLESLSRTLHLGKKRLNRAYRERSLERYEQLEKALEGLQTLLDNEDPTDDDESDREEDRGSW